VIIRRLTERDAEAFRALRLRALREDPEAFGASYEETAAQPLSAMAARLRPDATSHNVVLGAFDDHDSAVLIGMVGFRREQPAKSRHKGAIWGMYVPNEARGRGIGRALLERAIAEARTQAGLEQITLAVVSTNAAARQLYLSLGFVVYGVESRALKVDGRYLDEDLMVLHT